MPEPEHRDEKRLGVDLPREQIEELHNHVPWGKKKYVYQRLTEALLEALRESSNPTVVVALIIQGDISIKPILEHEAKSPETIDLRDG